jgi:hypothetical protein
MLPRELIEELVGGCSATRFHILVALADGIDSVLIILALPLEVVGQRVVERISRTPPSSARKVLQWRQSLRLERNRVHFLKVEVRHADVDSEAAFFPSLCVARWDQRRASYLSFQISMSDRTAGTSNSEPILRQVAIPIVGRVLARGDGIVWKVDWPRTRAFLVSVVLQV